MQSSSISLRSSFTVVALLLMLPLAAGCPISVEPMDAGSVDAGDVDAGDVDAGNVDAGDVDAGEVDAGDVDAGEVDAGDVDAGNVDAGDVDAGAVDAGEVDAGEVDAGDVDAGDVDAGDVDAGDVDAGDVDAGDVDAGNLDGGIVPTDAGAVDAGDVDAGDVDAGDVDAGDVDAGEVDAGGVDAGDVDAGDVDAGDVDAGTNAQGCALPPADLVEPTQIPGGRFVYVDNFDMGGGVANRALRVWLPVSYATSPDRTYPVVYLHDGQNVFEASTAAFGVEWEADETADRLAAAGVIEEVILVGVDNTANRVSDYTPDVDPGRADGGDGDLYIDALVHRVKPWVDANFRTECDRDHSAVLGSSLGGLISFRIAETAGETFGRVACFSPSFWWNNQSTLGRFTAFNGTLPQRLWIDGGNAEGAVLEGGVSSVILDNRTIVDEAVAKGAVFGATVAALEVTAGEHNEAAWRNRFGAALAWLMTDVELTPQSATAVAIEVGQSRVAVDEETWVRFQLDFATPVDAMRVTWPLESGPFAPAPVNARHNLVMDTEGAIVLRIGPAFADGFVERVVQAGNPTMTAVLFSVVTPEPTDDVVAVGAPLELGDWTPENGVGLVRDADGRTKSLVFVPASTTTEYKYTRGTWETVEKNAQGDEIANRQFYSDVPQVIRDEVVRWADRP